MLTRQYCSDTTLWYNGSYNRDPYGTENGDLLGETQWQWFEQELLTSTAAFNVIVSGVQILPADRYLYRIAECWDRFPHERQRLLKLILSSHAKGIILLRFDVGFATSMLAVVCFDTPLICRQWRRSLFGAQSSRVLEWRHHSDGSDKLGHDTQLGKRTGTLRSVTGNLLYHVAHFTLAL